MSTKAYDFYAYLRKGRIIVMLDASIKANTTADMQKQPVDLHILGKEGFIDFVHWFSEGMYINDDGEQRDIKGNYNRYYFSAEQSNNSLG